MGISRNALLLFCKPPIPGLVKTRLYKENGGPLSPEQAAAFFRASVLDEAELAMLAFDLLEEDNAAERAQDPGAPQRTYDLFVSTAPAEDLAVTKAFLVDKGASFDHHFNDAFDQIFARGYDNVVAMGGDMPLLPSDQLVECFKWLDFLASQNNGLGMVISPCQESGTSVVGRTRQTPVPEKGVFYNKYGRTVVEGYLEHLRDNSIPFAFLNAVSDVDNGADLAHLVTCLDAMAEAYRYQPGMYLPRRVLAWADSELIRAVAVPSDEYDPRHRIDSSEPV